MKKVFIISLAVFTIVVAGTCFSPLFSYVFNKQDACLDSGVCKEGLTLRMNDGQEIIINKDTCQQYNGEWRENLKDCIFRN